MDVSENGIERIQEESSQPNLGEIEFPGDNDDEELIPSISPAGLVGLASPSPSQSPTNFQLTGTPKAPTEYYTLPPMVESGSSIVGINIEPGTFVPIKSPVASPTTMAAPHYEGGADREIILPQFILSYLYTEFTLERISHDAFARFWDVLDVSLGDFMLAPTVGGDVDGSSDNLNITFQTFILAQEQTVIEIEQHTHYGNGRHNHTQSEIQNRTNGEHERHTDPFVRIDVQFVKKAYILSQAGNDDENDSDILDTDDATLSDAFSLALESLFIRSSHKSMSKVHSDFTNLERVYFREFLHDEHVSPIVGGSSKPAAASSGETSSNDTTLNLFGWDASESEVVYLCLGIGVAAILLAGFVMARRQRMYIEDLEDDLRRNRR